MSILKSLFGRAPEEPAAAASEPRAPALDQVWAALRRAGWHELLPNDHPPFVLPAADFFRGNTAEGSIAPNLAGLKNAPPHERFAQVFLEVAEQPSVSGVFVSIHEDSEPSTWPSSDTVYVVTSAAIDQLRQWVAALEPEDVCEQDDAVPIANPFPIPPGQRPYLVGWD